MTCTFLVTYLKYGTKYHDHGVQLIKITKQEVPICQWSSYSNFLVGWGTVIIIVWHIFK